MVDQSVVTVAKGYLQSLQRLGIAIRFGVVFGSWARGTAGRWSDIDLVVVSPQFDCATDRRFVDLLWCQAARFDSRIEPFLCGEKQWAEDDSSILIEVARREGQRVAVDDETS
jgi:uncharacterized protein